MNSSARSPLDLNMFFSDLTKFAEISDVPFNAQATQTIIDLFADIWAKDVIAVRTTSHPKGKRDINYRYMAPETPHDPYERLQQAGLLALEGHPIEKVIPEVVARFPVWWGADAAVSHGFEKLWLFFEQSIPFDEIYTLTSLPDSVNSHRELFKKYAAGYSVNIIGLDFHNKSLNLYPCPFVPGTYTPDRIASLLTDLDFAVPSAEELERVARTMWLYFTFRWDSPRIQRVCFTVYTPAEQYPYEWHPLCRPYVEQVPVRAENKMYIYSPTYGRGGSYLKIEADYEGRLPEIFGRYSMQKPLGFS
jgi:aromatic prenyltransferase